jgi:hypothetical protein
MINEQRITYRMKTLMESGFFGERRLLTEAFADKDKVRLFQAAYNKTYNKNLAVDGVKGGQTDAAIEDVKKQPSFNFEKLDNANAEVFFLNFLDILKMDNTINVGKGGTNNNKNQNYAVQALINLAGQPIGIDGVIGDKTIAAIKAVTGASELINKDNITDVIEKAKANVKELGVEGIATVKGKTPEEIKAESGKLWEKFPCVISQEGIKAVILKDNTIAYDTVDDKYRYYTSGKRQYLLNNSMPLEDYYCNGNTVTIGKMSDNTKAEGKCESGNCVDGTGKLITAAGDTHEGTFVKGKLTGTDNKIFFKAFDSYFKGETKDGQMVNGAYRYKDGSFYQGFFLNGKMHSNTALYMNAKGKRWRGDFRNGAPVGATFKELDAMANDEKETTFPTPAMQSGADDATKKKQFNEDMKILVGKIKDYRNQWGFYRVNANSITFSDSFDKEIFKTSNVFKELANIPSGRFWMYKPDTKKIFFYEADKNYYVHTIA